MFRNITEYAKLTPDELRAELVQSTSVLMGEYLDLGTATIDQHRTYLAGYVRSASNSVAGREREAEYNTMEETTQVMHKKAAIQALHLRRDLAMQLLGMAPSGVPFAS